MACRSCRRRILSLIRRLNMRSAQTGGAIAWFARRQDAPGAVILGIGNALVGTHGVHYTLAACSAFPRHLLSALSCAGIIVFLVLCIQRKRWTRLLSAGTTVLIVACIVLYACLNGLKI